MRRHLGTFLPALLSVALFGVAVFWFVLPRTEEAILAKKRELVRELTASACSLLASYEQQERSGLLRRDVAQARALGRLREMRYGPVDKDYFWIIDTEPKVLMHPYRLDMVGQLVWDFADSGGHYFFRDAVRVSKQDGEGFISYLWQRHDDPGLQAPKTSHVRLFQPWGWIVGTGIYTDDVAAEMASMTRQLTLAGACVMGLVSLLAGYIAWRNLKVDEERQRAVEALQESEEKFRGIGAGALDGIIMIDPRGRIMFVNQAAQDIFGYQAREMLGMELHLLLAPSRYHEEYRRAFSRFTASGHGQAIGQTLELAAVNKAGDELPIELSVSAINLRGQWHAVGIIRDITKRKQAQRDLQRSEEKFRQLFQTSPVSLTITTVEEGVLLEVNDTALAEYGFTREEVIGRSPVDLGVFMDAAARDAAVEEFKRGGRRLHREVTMRRKDGTLRDYLWSADSLEYEGRACLLNVLLDVTEANKARQEKRSLEDQLRQAQKMEAIGTLAAGIAHDFNNILSAVLGYADLAIKRTPPGEKTHRYMSEVYNAGLRARDLVQQILTFSRQTKVDASPVEVRLLVKEAMKMLRATISSTIDIQTDIAETSGKVLADPGQIHQIVMNLCANAQHAMRETGGTLKVGLDEARLPDEVAPGLEALPPGTYLRLTVADSGRGMSPQVQERIFDPFFTTKSKGEGTGLGLSVVHGIVDKLGGGIAVQSAPERGTTFHVLLPLWRGNPVEAAQAAAALPGGRERILVADDEETVGQAHRLLLESLGYRVEVSLSGRQAWDLLLADGQGFDLILTDLAMPEMDGLELIRRVRQGDQAIPIILLTGFVDEERLTPRLRELGVDRLMVKPVVFKDLARDIRAVLDARGKRPAAEMTA